MKSEDLNSASDDNLIALIKEGNRLAFNSLFERYWKNLFGFALSIFNDREPAEDAVQEVFIGLWERRNSLDIKNPKAYLFQAVRFQIANQICRVKFTEKAETVINKISSTNSVEDQINYQELNEQILQIAETMPDRQREIFHMSRYENLSNKEISEKLNISIRTVENQITKALQTIRTSIKASSVLLMMEALSSFK